MAYCKRFIILFLILFILFFNFSSVFATDDMSEDVIADRVDGIYILPTQNFFKSASNQTVGYFYLESGYKYIIENTSDSYPRYLALCNEVPAVNGTYTFLYQIPPLETYEYISNGSYLVFSYSNYLNTTITKVKLASQDSAINDLVQNVGPNAFWDVFGNGIDFVFVVVIVVFGLFIIVKLIKGLSKGKSKI